MTEKCPLTPAPIAWKLFDLRPGNLKSPGQLGTENHGILDRLMAEHLGYLAIKKNKKFTSNRILKMKHFSIQ